MKIIVPYFGYNFGGCSFLILFKSTFGTTGLQLHNLCQHAFRYANAQVLAMNHTNHYSLYSYTVSFSPKSTFTSSWSNFINIHVLTHHIHHSSHISTPTYSISLPRTFFPVSTKLSTQRSISSSSCCVVMIERV